ncbi:MAG: UpxY family transcription antiterminator [Phycisphaeraceae bacterium]|nr:UpxY family transcription antiterminator [Phycisphaeraceae bacterium]
MTSCLIEPRQTIPTCGSLVNAATAQRWFVLHTRSRQEKAVATTIDALGCQSFLPLVTTSRLYGKRKAVVDLPLFPGYVFFHGSREHVYDLDRTGRVAQIIDVRDQDQLIRELDSIRQALASSASLDPYPYLRVGIRVVVRSGPLCGIQGLIENRTSSHRLILQIDVLGQACSLEIDGALLEPLD